jgi:hypothetical protein
LLLTEIKGENYSDFCSAIETNFNYTQFKGTMQYVSAVTWLQL